MKLFRYIMLFYICIGCPSVVLALGHAESDLKLLQSLVEINSGTKNTEGVNRVQDIVEQELKKLGLNTTLVENPVNASKSGKFLIAVLPGVDEHRYITLIAHADTVFEPETGFKDYLMSGDGKIARGPGVGDNKGGLVIAIAALRKYLARHPGKPALSIRFISAASEEDGGGDFKTLFDGFSKDSDYALGLEPTNPDGSIVEGRSGIQKWAIHISGKEAHAGTDHASGASACHELSVKIAKLHDLTDYKKGITVNVGSISGGSGKYNIVCGSADAKLEMRFKSPEAMIDGLAKAKRILDTVYIRSTNGSIPTKTEYKSEATTMPFSINKVSAPHILRYRKILSKLENVDRKSIHINGLADINRMVHKKMVAMDDLGPIGGNSHTKDEYIEIQSIETRSEALALFLAEILGKHLK